MIALAKEDGKEVHFDIPEDRINQINVGDSLFVSLWNNQDRQIEAYIREIAVSADPANRTYRVKATLSSSQQDLKLGRSVTVQLSSREQEVLGIPLSAVFAPHDKHDQTKVWVVDENKRSVSAVPVQLGVALPENRIAVKGVEPGQLLVSAGVHRLREGQVIRLPIETTAWPETSSVVVNKSEGQQP
ncbi:efflux RND transporter periplasmic adaptor subunit [Methylobacter luteus]|uniref:efflux RND transporter periplasmic adaptor subunit n=1 Tax=Methylobacter luteus TaxID=415 RepID=UPI0009DBF76A